LQGAAGGQHLGEARLAYADIARNYDVHANSIVSVDAVTSSS
jgi:hypothetical protein